VDAAGVEEEVVDGVEELDEPEEDESLELDEEELELAAGSLAEDEERLSVR